MTYSDFALIFPFVFIGIYFCYAVLISVLVATISAPYIIFEYSKLIAQGGRPKLSHIIRSTIF